MRRSPVVVQLGGGRNETLRPAPVPVVAALGVIKSSIVVLYAAFAMISKDSCRYVRYA